jgi:hypothetical protein
VLATKSSPRRPKGSDRSLGLVVLRAIMKQEAQRGKRFQMITKPPEKALLERGPQGLLHRGIGAWREGGVGPSPRLS